jgi:prepilin-type processing-associated H-X9-DG protein
MRQIGQAMLLYSNEHRGKYPDDLGILIKTEDISIDVFTCPSSGTSIPPNIRNGSMAQKMAWVNEQSDYVYLGKGKTNTTSPETVTVYEKLTDHGNDGINMLFGDGHVEFQMLKGAKDLLQKQGVNGPKEGEL